MSEAEQRGSSVARLCTAATRSAMGASVGENVVISPRTSSRGSSLNCEPSESSRCHCDQVRGLLAVAGTVTATEPSSPFSSWSASNSTWLAPRSFSSWTWVVAVVGASEEAPLENAPWKGLMGRTEHAESVATVRREAERVAEPVVLSRGYLSHPPAVKDVGVAQGGHGYREPPPVRAGAVCSSSQLLG